VIYGGRRQVLVEWEGWNQPEIELNDATVASSRMKSLENSVQLELNAQVERRVFCVRSILLFK
jgi:hypothetical protein